MAQALQSRDFRLYNHPWLNKAQVLPDVQLMMQYDNILQELEASPRRGPITGVAGFISSNVLEQLHRSDQSVTGPDDFPTGYPHNLDDVRNEVGEDAWADFTVIDGDTRNTGCCAMACEGDGYDPHVPVIKPSREHGHRAGMESVEWVKDTISSFDLSLILTNQSEVDHSPLASWSKVVVDTRHVVNGEGNTYRA